MSVGPLAALAAVALLVSAVVLPRAAASFTDTTSNGTNAWETADAFPKWAALDVGFSHACGVDRFGGVWCWGASAQGANGSIDDRTRPVQITSGFPTGTKLVEVAAGEFHSCALTDEGRAWCWGANWNGQLGSTTNLGSSTTTPQAVVTTTMTRPLTAITLGEEHTCASDDAGALWCWGLNLSGQLGNGTTTRATSPSAVSDLGATATHVAAGGHHTCAVSTAASTHPRAWCWGEQADGRLGNGSTASGGVLVPTLVSTSETVMPGAVASVTAGVRSSCALQETGKGWCWGFGDHGRLGIGTTTTHSVPQAIVTSPTDLTFAGIEAGFRGTCAFGTDGRPWCWGRNGQGEIGDGPASTTPQSPSDTSNRLVPTAVTTTNLSEPVSQIASGDMFACAFARGDVWCWGSSDHGRLGNGSNFEVYDNPQWIPD